MQIREPIHDVVRRPIAPIGKVVTWDLSNLFRFNDVGQLVKEDVRTDYRSFLRQLGADGA